MEPGENLYMGGGILRRGDRVGLSCCSNGLLEADKGSLELLKERAGPDWSGDGGKSFPVQRRYRIQRNRGHRERMR